MIESCDFFADPKNSAVFLNKLAKIFFLILQKLVLIKGRLGIHNQFLQFDVLFDIFSWKN